MNDIKNYEKPELKDLGLLADETRSDTVENFDDPERTTPAFPGGGS